MNDEKFAEFFNKILMQTNRVDFMRYKYNRVFITDILWIIAIDFTEKQDKMYMEMYKPLIDNRMVFAVEKLKENKRIYDLKDVEKK